LLLETIGTDFSFTRFSDKIIPIFPEDSFQCQFSQILNKLSQPLRNFPWALKWDRFQTARFSSH